MREEETLFGWVRYYFVLIVVFIVVGIGLGIGYVQQALQRSESSFIIIEERGIISALNVGPRVSAVFESSRVYERALGQLLDLNLTPQELYDQHVELLPVPDTQTLYVIGRADDLPTAERIARVVSLALVIEMNRTGENVLFVVFSGPQPPPSSRGASTKVAGALGGSTGLWLGLALAIIHYRWKRPVLTFRNALDITEADHAAVVEGRWWRWFGFMRPGVRWKNTPGNRIRLSRLVPPTRPEFEVEVVGGSARSEAAIARVITAAVDAGRPRVESGEVTSNGAGTNGAMSVVVVHAGTGERDLNLVKRMLVAPPEAEQGDGSVALVWVR
ncbi:MAG TPA: hypothetical protein VEV82_11535 [Actinomycetota bacterium]|nr:hypothetical protein [Actinomycetota bacterium]